MLCCTTVQRKRYYTTNSNKIHVNTTTNTVYVFIHFDDNTSRSYSPYQPPKPFLQSIDITCYFRHTKQAKYLHSFLSTVIQAVSHRPSRSYRTVLHGIDRRSYHTVLHDIDPRTAIAQHTNRSKNRSNTSHITSPSSPQVVPTVQSPRVRPPIWIARLIDRILSKIQAAVSVYCDPLHLTLVITSRYQDNTLSVAWFGNHSVE